MLVLRLFVGRLMTLLGFCRLRMKGGFYGLKGKQISLITIVLMCATILIWGWEKTPLLTTLVPSETPLELDADNFVRTQEEMYISKGLATFAQKDGLKKEVRLEEASPLGSGQSSRKSYDIGRDLVTTHAETIGNDKEIVEGKQEEQTTADTRKNERMDKENSDRRKQNMNGATPTGSVSAGAPECNYAMGKWVVDDKKPLYSGFDCKQWLSGMWACRLMQRSDFAYEKVSWQPNDCQMEEFEGSKFLKRLQGKTLAFVGDSLGRQQFQSLMCMITGGKEMHNVIDVGMEYGMAQERGDTRPGGWAYRFPSTNTTILYHWSSTLCDVEPINATDPHTDYAMHLDRPPAFLRQYIHKLDVVVLNTGHHWNRGKLNANRWVMHVGGVRNTNKKIAMMWKAKNVTVHSVVKWVDSQLPKYPGLKVFYRTISPRHFVGGEWNTGGSCDNTTPMSIGKEVMQNVSSDTEAASAVKGTGVKLLDITALSQVRDEGHISRFSLTAKPGVQDCLHWCLPGVPDTWNEILFAQI